MVPSLIGKAQVAAVLIGVLGGVGCHTDKPNPRARLMEAVQQQMAARERSSARTEKTELGKLVVDSFEATVSGYQLLNADDESIENGIELLILKPETAPLTNPSRLRVLLLFGNFKFKAAFESNGSPTNDGWREETFVAKIPENIPLPELKEVVVFLDAQPTVFKIRRRR